MMRTILKTLFCGVTLAVIVGLSYGCATGVANQSLTGDAGTPDAALPDDAFIVADASASDAEVPDASGPDAYPLPESACPLYIMEGYAYWCKTTYGDVFLYVCDVVVSTRTPPCGVVDSEIWLLHCVTSGDEVLVEPVYCPSQEAVDLIHCSSPPSSPDSTVGTESDCSRVY